MKRKKSLTKNSVSNTKALRRVWFIVIALLAAVIVIGWQLYLRNEHQGSVDRLTYISNVFDKTKQTLEPDYSSKRNESCYRTSEKYNDGHIVCKQELSILGVASSNNEIKENIAKITESIQNYTDFDNLINKEMIAFNENDAYLNTIPLEKSHKNYPELCRIEITAYGVSYSPTDLAGSYSVNLSCAEKGLRATIY